jgi:hypothetical protein
MCILMYASQGTSALASENLSRIWRSPQPGKLMLAERVK